MLHFLAVEEIHTARRVCSFGRISIQTQPMRTPRYTATDSLHCNTGKAKDLALTKFSRVLPRRDDYAWRSAESIFPYPLRAKANSCVPRVVRFGSISANHSTSA